MDHDRNTRNIHQLVPENRLIYNNGVYFPSTAVMKKMRSIPRGYLEPFGDTYWSSKGLSDCI